MKYSKELCFTNLPNTTIESGHNTNIRYKLHNFVDNTYPDCDIEFKLGSVGIIEGIEINYQISEQLAHIMLMFGLFVGEEYMASRFHMAKFIIETNLELKI